MGIASFSDRMLGRASGIWTFVSPVVPGTVGAVVTGWLSSGVTWISQYGAFGWWCAALVGGLAATAIYLGSAVARERFAHASAARKWAREIDDINPMSKQFSDKRFKIADLAHPITRVIKGKQFIDCDMIGPENIIFTGATSLGGNEFWECNIVVCHDNATIFAPVIFDGCTIQGCKISRCTLFMPSTLWAANAGKMTGANVVTHVP